MKRYIIIIYGIITGLAAAQSNSLSPLFPDETRQHTEKALHALVMTMEDAGFAKNHGNPQWSLAWITNTLNDPWQLPVVADRIFDTAVTGETVALWDLAADLLELPTLPARIEAPDDGERTLDAVIGSFLVDVKEASHLLEVAFADVPASNRAALVASWLVTTFETEDFPQHREVLINGGITREIQEQVDAEGRLLDTTESSLVWLQQIEQIDMAKLHQAAMVFHRAVDHVRAKAGQVSSWPEEVVTQNTEWGQVVIGTETDDTYDGPALLILDPGGNDTYRATAGAANGLLGQSLAAVIDLAGNDRYASEALLSAGAALWGIAMVMDQRGDDTHDAHYMGSGTAVFGAAWMEDMMGDDRYRGHALGQGAGIVGFGFLIDHEGDDHYHIGFYGQGFSGVNAWGTLIDRAGNDVYVAGNKNKDHERDDDRYFSFAQGFSIGMRPHAGGGVAALIDLSGNDSYLGDIYAQGVSYYYAAGFLLDGGGNDRYAMYQYGQGCGIHLSLGLLADASGNDFYTGYILAQGAAHDYAVGMLFDHAGDDTYTADHHAQGRALNNAFALLVDRAGNDGYFGRQRGGTQGIGNEGGFRDYGSLALLLDLGGDDVYSGGFSNQTMTLRPLYGVVYDE